MLTGLVLEFVYFLSEEGGEGFDRRRERREIAGSEIFARGVRGWDYLSRIVDSDSFPSVGIGRRFSHGVVVVVVGVGSCTHEPIGEFLARKRVS